VVDAPDEGASDFPDGGESDDADRLRPHKRWERQKGSGQHGEGEGAERELDVQPKLRVEREEAGEIGRQNERVAARNHQRRYWSSCQLGVGRSSRSARPPFVSANVKS